MTCWKLNEPQRQWMYLNEGHMRPAMIQISLRIRAVWSESSVYALWRVKEVKFLRADDEDWSHYADAQTDLSLPFGAHIRRYICPKAQFHVAWLKWFFLRNVFRPSINEANAQWIFFWLEHIALINLSDTLSLHQQNIKLSYMSISYRSMPLVW